MHSSTPSHQFAIKTTALTRRFGEILAVDALDLEVPAGGIYCFLGPNGAGKTTTIRMLLGLIHADAGSVEVFGQNLRDARCEVLRSVGALVEMPSVYEHLSGRDNLEVTRRMLGVGHEQIDRVLAIVHLKDAAHRRVDGYSLGMKQRLGLALSLLGEPDLLILDEPTNGLDPAGIHEMRELITELPREHGVTVFLSSHLLSEVEHLADHLGIVRQGQLCYQGTLEDLQTRRQSYVALGLDREQEARSLLAASGWEVLPSSNGQLHAAPQDLELSSESVESLNELLVNRGFRIHHLSHQQPSLERLFLDMTHLEEGA